MSVYSKDCRICKTEKDVLQAQIDAANKILAEIATYPEYQNFIENNIIPCQAPCARQYEELCRRIQELNASLSQDETRGVKQ